jgi:hypothetical protein
MRDAPDGFYVGYAARAGRARAKVALISAALLGVRSRRARARSAQRRLDLRLFEFAHNQFERSARRPTLLVARPGGGISRYLLVGPGKHGALPRRGFAAARPPAANLISRGPETAPRSCQDRSRPLPGTRRGAVDLGERVLRGEIVDSKCHLGVMNPGEGKAHKACAIRCISGGAPPLLRVREPQDDARYFLLAGEDGREVGRELLDFVAEPVEIHGRAERHDDVYVLRIEPGAVRRLTDGESAGTAP